MYQRAPHIYILLCVLFYRVVMRVLCVLFFRVDFFFTVVE